MKTNLFKFRKLNKNRIVLEEDEIDSHFLLFLKNKRKYIMLILILLALISLIISLYYAIKNINESSKLVTNINHVVVDFETNDTINSINMKPITGGEALKEFYNRYGNIGLREGVIFVSKEVSFKRGKIVFYSDGSAKIIGYKGDITRISALENGDYGIKENGDIIKGANTKYVSIEKRISLEDGTEILYYSDKSCEIFIPSRKITMLVRNSERLVIKENRLFTISPSGVNKELKLEKLNGYKINYYEDGTIKIEHGNETYIVRNKEDIDLNSMTFPNNNAATILKTVSLKDGNKIIYYTDGSAEIKTKDESVMVRQSKDIIYTEKRVIEIIETKYANETIVRKTPNNKEIIYLDNGGAVIKNPNGTYEYVYENSDIKYEENGNIKNGVTTVKEIAHKTSPDGTIIINLEDGNSIIIDENGYRVVKTDKIIYDKDGNIKGIEGEIDKDKDELSVSDSVFEIENQGEDDVKYKVVIEISDNYKDYAPVKLNPIYLRYNIIVDTTYLENQTFNKQMEVGTILEGGNKIEKETYILYEGTLKKGTKSKVDLGIWLDYDDITNDYKNSVFVGTVKVYSETIK